MIYTSPAGARAIETQYREALASWPVPHEQRSIATSYGQTFVVVCGPVGKPPLVLLHGSSANASSWAEAIPAWAQHFRVHAIDILGEPGLSADTRLELGSDDPARWLDEVLEALDLSATAAVGESLGAWLAVDYASRRPGRVTRLALLCPGGIGRQRGESIVIALLLRLTGLRRSMAWLVGSDDIPDSALLVQRHFRPRMRPLPVFDDQTLRRLTMPLLVVAGARDRMFDTAGTRRRLAATAENAEIMVLPERGHALPRPTERVLGHLRAAEHGTQDG